MIKKSNLVAYFVLFIITIFAAFLRLYKVDSNPPAITWDEATVGYNAFTILNWGKDEWGNSYPLFFKSFGDDKNPLHIYATVPFVALFGLNDFAVRLPAALLGILNVVLIFFVSRRLTKSDVVGLLSSLFLAFSTYNVQFSRFNHELNFAIFFFLVGLYLFLKFVQDDKKMMLPLSFLFFGLDLFTYPSAKVVTPLLVILLLFINIRKLLKVKMLFLVGIAIYTFFVGVIVANPELLGTARLGQNEIKEDLILQTDLYKKTSNKLLGKIEVIFERYIKYYHGDFLYVYGDDNPRHSVQAFGTFYKFQIPLLILGLFYLVYDILKNKNYNLLVVLLCFIISPLPGAVSSELPHASRAMFITFSHYLLISMGSYLSLKLFKSKYYKTTITLTLLGFTLASTYNYLDYYYNVYRDKYSIEWIYGMKEIVEEAKKDDYYRVYITDSRMQPYIFVLFYTQKRLPEFLNSVKYNETQSKSHNLISSFDKYKFVWDEYNSLPTEGILYVVKPSVYDGLYYKNDFDVVKNVKYLDNSDAFYLITAKKAL